MVQNLIRNCLCLLLTASIQVRSSIPFQPASVGDSPEKSTLFVHGLGGGGADARGYHHKGHTNGFVEGSLKTFNFSHATDPLKSSLGQHADCRSLHASLREQCPNLVTIVALSCGAATTINELGRDQPNNVIATVLESPFCCVRDVSDNAIGALSHVPGFGWLVHRCVPFLYPNYDPNDIQPGDSVHDFPHIPVLFVCSKEDGLIPYESTMELFRKCVESGHSNAYLLVTDQGEHANILRGPDGERYRNVVHAFYRRHNLPYNPQWAEEGMEDFARCQPDVTDLDN